jgi:hypothetical protein
VQGEKKLFGGLAKKIARLVAWYAASWRGGWAESSRTADYNSNPLFIESYHHRIIGDVRRKFAMSSS